MKDLGKLLREKLEAADHSVDASMYTINAGSLVSVGSGGGGMISTSSINNPRHWTVMDEIRADIEKLDYILQRIVPNYDELVAQYKAVKDIEEAGK